MIATQHGRGQMAMSQEGPERKQTEPIDRFAPPKRQLEYLNGKPICRPRWLIVLYIALGITFGGVLFGSVILDSIRAGAPFGAREILVLVGPIECGIDCCKGRWAGLP